MEFVLRKKENKAEYWPRLLKESKKVHFLKTNFDKVGTPQRVQGKGIKSADRGLCSGLMRTSKMPRLKTIWEAWAVWEVACQVWRAWAEWVAWVAWAAWAVMEALVASVSLRAFPNYTQILIKPDFSKLGGGAGGMPDMPDMGDLGDDAEEGGDDDEEMPELEDEAEGEEGKGKGKEAAEPATSAKIEEVS